jgi:protein-S-isoprenylcysteine O-methyltransferase Ste14
MDVNTSNGRTGKRSGTVWDLVKRLLLGSVGALLQAIIFFSDVIRIQMDRGHVVVSDGPYRYVRHPGYVGMILLLFATPLLLNSLWALIPGGLTALIIIARTVVEDRTLLEELDGYKDYARCVRYRLLPGVW